MLVQTDRPSRRLHLRRRVQHQGMFDPNIRDTMLIATPSYNHSFRFQPHQTPHAGPDSKVCIRESIQSLLHLIHERALTHSFLLLFPFMTDLPRFRQHVQRERLLPPRQRPLPHLPRHRRQKVPTTVSISTFRRMPMGTTCRLVITSETMSLPSMG